MGLQAFIDDSYSQNGVFVLGGFIASEETWASFSKDWEEMLPMGVLTSSGEYHFKMSEMARSSDRMERVGVFLRVIEKHDVIPISLKIDIGDLKRAIDRVLVLETWINFHPFDIPFVFAFRALMDCFHHSREKFSNLVSTSAIVDFIFDEQSEKKILLPYWDEYLRSRTDSSRRRYGAVPRFENDRSFLPLQAADLWAWSMRDWYENGSTDDYVLYIGPNWTRWKEEKIGLNISFDEDQIVTSLIELIESERPELTIYDQAKFKHIGTYSLDFEIKR